MAAVEGHGRGVIRGIYDTYPRSCNERDGTGRRLIRMEAEGEYSGGSLRFFGVKRGTRMQPPPADGEGREDLHVRP